MKKLTALLCSLVVLTVFSACEENTGSSELSETTSVTTVQTKVTTEKITTQTSTEPPITNYTEDVYSVYAYMKQICKDVGEYIEYTEENDPNKSLGKPGEYTQKINFSIKSIPEDNSYYPGLGACIEIYEDSKTADKKKKLHQSSEDYSTYASGNVVLRITNSVDENIVNELQNALNIFIKKPQSFISQKEKLKQDELHSFNDLDSYKSVCSPCEYEEIARDNDALIGQRFTFTGEIIQVLNGEYRMNITQNEYGYYEDTIIFVYDIGDNDRLLEGDIVTIWGNSLGFATYTSVLGQEITIPAIEARVVELEPVHIKT